MWTLNQDTEIIPVTFLFIVFWIIFFMLKLAQQAELNGTIYSNF